MIIKTILFLAVIGFGIGSHFEKPHGSGAKYSYTGLLVSLVLLILNLFL